MTLQRIGKSDLKLQETQQYPYRIESKSKEHDEIIEQIEEDEMLVIQMSSNNYDILDGESPNKCIEANTDDIYGEGMIIIMAGNITCHFHFACLEALSLKVFTSCQNVFDIYSAG